MTTETINDLGAKLQDGAYKMVLPALKGHMGGVDYYVITLPFSVAKRYLTTTDPSLPARERENRKPKPFRYREISQYITMNPDDYRFSALTCTFGKNGTNSPISWHPASESGDASTLGILELDQRDPLVIVDGQHRFAAILKALEEDQGLDDETITIVLFPYINLRHNQQLFSDLNRTAKKTTKSLDILFDYRDITNRIVQKVVEEVSVFQERVNLEDASVPINSDQVFTLAGIYQASTPILIAANSKGIIGDDSGEDASEDISVEFLVDTWEFISGLFPEWGKVSSGEMSIREQRSKFLHWNSGVISTIGEFVGMAIRERDEDWKELVRSALLHEDNQGWRRDALYWQGIITAGTLVLPRSAVRAGLTAHLKNLVGLPLSDTDKKSLQYSQEIKGDLAASNG